MKFHIYRASKPYGKMAVPEIDDSDEVAEFKANPPCPNAILEESEHIYWHAKAIYWTIELNSLDELFEIYDHFVIRRTNYEIKGLRTIVIYDGYIE